MTLGNLIRKARKARGISLEQLGAALGVSRQLVWQWERDKSDARKHIEGLSKTLETPVDYFYGPARAGGPLEAKIKRLSPEQHDLIETMIDKLLGQQDEKTAKLTGRAEGF